MSLIYCHHTLAFSCRILAGDKWETVFLLSGDDLKVHMYKESFSSEVSHNYPFNWILALYVLSLFSAFSFFK